MADVAVLDVLLYGEPIGTLTRVGGDRMLFAFNDAYIADGTRPVLGLGFKDRLGGLITDFPPTQTKLLPPFALKALIRSCLLANAATAFHIPSHTGERLGTVQDGPRRT